MHTTTQDRWKIRAILFFISQSITLFGSTLVQMAIVWYVNAKHIFWRMGSCI